ncbi:MAG TPA: hypothetical protein VIG99_28440 [Myxococcaceae bacterium]
MPTNPTASTPATAKAPAAPKPPPNATGVTADTFKRLTPDVAAGKLPEKDAQMLAVQSARPGVIGEAQAITAARKAAALPPADRAQFQQAVDGGKSDTERAFLYKALAAGHPVSEIADFAKQIQGLSDKELLRDYTLSGPLGTEETPGLHQQFTQSCVPSVAETLRGDADPIYAGNVHAQNEDVHYNMQVDNRSLASEEKKLLEGTGGGRAVPFTSAAGGGGVPTQSGKIDDVLNSVSKQTGLTYHQSHLDKNNRRASPAQEALVDQMAAQLQQGIPTPFEVRSPDDTRGHEALAIAVEGSVENEDQRFLVHDPGTGETAWLSRREFLFGTDQFGGGWQHYGLAGVALAQEQLPPEPQAAAGR